MGRELGAGPGAARVALAGSTLAGLAEFMSGITEQAPIAVEKSANKGKAG